MIHEVSHLGDPAIADQLVIASHRLAEELRDHGDTDAEVATLALTVDMLRILHRAARRRQEADR